MASVVDTERVFRAPSAHELRTLAAVFVLVFLSAWAGIELTREAGRIASIWVANGILAAFLLRAPSYRWPCLAISAYTANLSVNLLAGDMASVAVGLSACNTLETLICAVPLRRRFGRDFDLTRPEHLAWFIAMAAIAPIVPALFASTILALANGFSPVTILGNWFASDALGLLIVTPFMLTLRQGDFRILLQPENRKAVALLVVSTAVSLAVAFSQTDYPLQFIVIPIAVMAAVSLGSAGAAVAIAAIATVSIVATIHGYGPMMLISGSVTVRIFVLQAFLAVLVLTTMQIVAVFAERLRLEGSLRDAKREAERANRAKSDFLARMSHEMRTPLNSVIGFAGVALATRNLESEVRRQIELIQRGGSALLMVVNDVLDFSKIDAGKVELESRPFWLKGLAENCLSLVRPAAAEKGLMLSLQLHPETPPRVLGDEARLQQVILNLLNNAIKFTASGGVKLVLRPVAGARIEFAVIDTGIGITEADIGRLFEDFMQVDGSISRKFGGTGLGLAISNRLVKLMGGAMGVVSAPEKGSTFWLTLPLDEADAEDEADATLIDLPTRCRPSKLLLVDDVDINLEIAASYLEALGHVVETARNGRQALELAQSGAYDLILMDVQMPDLDGVEATRMLRATEGPNRSTPILALTANVFAEQVEIYRGAGMNDHIGKPFRSDDLARALARWLPPETAGERDAA